MTQIDLATPVQSEVTYLSIHTSPPLVCSRYDVYLDGVKQNHCTEADVANGFVRSYVMEMTDKGERFVLTNKRRIKVVRKNGVVLIAKKSYE